MSKIEWTDRTWNPLAGCRKVSAGCDNCYAIRMSNRLSGIGHSKEKYEGTVRRMENGELNWTGEDRFIESELDKPAKWKKPSMIFVCSMSDIGYAGYTAWRKIMNVCIENKQHIFQILTKRPSALLHNNAINRDSYSTLPERGLIDLTINPHIWVGVTVENQKAADERLPLLRQIPAAVKFLSCEPLLGKIDLNLTDIDWVIIGGESGPGARPMHHKWVDHIIEQCNHAGVPVFFKQYGDHFLTSDFTGVKYLKQDPESTKVIDEEFGYDKYKKFPVHALVQISKLQTQNSQLTTNPNATN